MAQKGAAGDFFFHFCKKKYFFPKIDNIFMEKKIKWKKKKIAAARLASNYCSHPLYRKQNFFYGQPGKTGRIRGVAAGEGEEHSR